MESKIKETPQSKEDFIGEYLNKKMKNHNLPLSLEYYNLLAKHETKAEKLWNAEMNKILKSIQL